MCVFLDSTGGLKLQRTTEAGFSFDRLYKEQLPSEPSLKWEPHQVSWEDLLCLL